MIDLQDRVQKFDHETASDIRQYLSLFAQACDSTETSHVSLCLKYKTFCLNKLLILFILKVVFLFDTIL